MNELITYPLNDVDYSAEDAGLFHCTRKSGVWYEDSFPIEVSGADNTIFIGKGLAWFSNTEFWGKVAAQKTKVSLDLEYADPVYDRIDVIALQFDANKNATNLIVKKGEAKTKPTIPSISRTEAVYELYLYAITRPAASLTVMSENVRDLRLDDAYCGLMADSVTSLDFPVVPIEKGGTNATNVAKARENLGLGVGDAIENLLTLPNNTSPSADTPDEWEKLGTCKIYYNSSSGNVVNKPTTYGTLINIVGTIKVAQIWFRQAYGTMYVRAGNATGWNGVSSVSGADAWKQLFDNSQTIPLENGGTGASTASGARTNLEVLGNSGLQELINGTLRIMDTNNTGQGLAVRRPYEDGYRVYSALVGSDGGAYIRISNIDAKENSDVLNYLWLGEEKSVLNKPLTIGSGGTGATTAKAARENLGISLGYVPNFAAQPITDGTNQYGTTSIDDDNSFQQIIGDKKVCFVHLRVSFKPGTAIPENKWVKMAVSAGGIKPIKMTPLNADNASLGRFAAARIDTDGTIYCKFSTSVGTSASCIYTISGVYIVA